MRGALPADGGRFAWDLKAGGAYVPLDPAYPQDRLTQMIEDSAPAVLVTLAGICRTFVG